MGATAERALGRATIPVLIVPTSTRGPRRAR